MMLNNLEVDTEVFKPIKLIDCEISLDENCLEIQKEINSACVTVELDWELDIETEMSLNMVSYEFEVDLMYKIEGGGQYPEYHGPYVVVPKSVDQELGTKDKITKRNVLVKEVPTYEVSNVKGYTFTIL